MRKKNKNSEVHDSDIPPVPFPNSLVLYLH